MSQVIAVSGAVGGIGASTLSYAIALQSASTSMLIDAQAAGVPLEVLIGGEAQPGTRWHQIHLSSAAIDPVVVLNALPQWNGVRFLSANRFGTAHLPALAHLVAAMRDSCDRIVIDVNARSSLLDAVQADVHVLIVPNTIYGLGAAVASMRDNTVLVVTRTHLEDFRAVEIGRYLTQPVLGVIEHERSVWMALRHRAAIPAQASVMRIAAQLTTRFSDAA